MSTYKLTQSFLRWCTSDTQKLSKIPLVASINILHWWVQIRSVMVGNFFKKSISMPLVFACVEYVCMCVLSMYVSMYECTYLCVMSWAVLFKIVLSFDYIVANVTLISNFLVVDVPYVLVKVAFCLKRFRRVTYLTCVHNATLSFVLHPCFTDKVLLTIFVASPLCRCIF